MSQDQIQFRIVEIKKLNHFENDFHEFGLQEDDLNDVGIELTHGLAASPGEDAVIVKLTITYLNNKNTDQKLFGITTNTKFEIKDLQKKYVDKKANALNLPIKIIHTVLSISISSVRGILAALNTNPAYQKMILPIINPSELVKSNNVEKNK